MKPDMTVDISGMILKNPVMTASGTFGYGEEYDPYVDIGRLGAVVVKGLSPRPKEGNPPPRIMETAAGMLNAVGLENVGISTFVDTKLPFLKGFDTPVVVNIFGDTIDEYVEVASIAGTTEGIHALEVNISCPNVTKGGLAFGADPAVASEVTRRVKEVSERPVIVKLTPNVTDITVIARACEDAGADAVSLINTLLGLSINIETRRPHISNITGGLSGPAVKPVALRMVRETARTVSIPVIGLGGIMTADDAVAFLIAGASAVQVGTANFVNPRVTMEIIDGIEDYLARHDIDSVRHLVGTLIDD